MHDIAEFLHRHEPFRQLDEAETEQIAAHTEVEFFPEGTVIFEQGASARTHVWIVRRGAVELRDGTQVLDGLTEGELFGHPSMLTGLPTEFAARAAEDTLCYRIEAADITALLTGPAGMRYLTRELRHREALRSTAGTAVGATLTDRRVAALLDRRVIVCPPETPIGDAAREMVSADVSCVVVPVADGFGIVTDHDMRAKVIAADRSADAPLREIMTVPAICADPEMMASDAALMMIERGVRHVPVVDGGGTVTGILRDVDLLASDTRTPFTLRRQIATARTPEELADAGRRLREVLVALHGAGTTAQQISRVHSAIADALIIRLLGLIAARHGRPGLVPMWIALGSHGRRELAPGSDLDSAATWPAHTPLHDERVLREVARETVAATAARAGAGAGLAADENGETAASELFARSLESWRQAVRRWAADPTGEKIPIVLSALLDGRPVGAGPAWSSTVLAEMSDHTARQQLGHWLLRLALARRPPTGFWRGHVLAATGNRRTIDLKRDGLLPIVDLARYCGYVAGGALPSTPARLQAGARHGILTEDDARLLGEAHELFTDMRISHHIELLRAGEPISDAIDPGTLNPLARSYVKDAFALVAGVQRRMSDRVRLA